MPPHTVSHGAAVPDLTLGQTMITERTSQNARASDQRQEPSRRRNDLGRGAHRGTPLCASLECLTLKHRAAPYRLCRTHAHGASRYARTQDVSRGLARRPSPSPSEEPLRCRDVQSAKPGRVCVQGLGTSRRETGEGHRAEPQHCTCPAPWGSCSIKPADADSTQRQESGVKSPGSQYTQDRAETAGRHPSFPL